VEEVENKDTTTSKDKAVVEKSFETEARPGDKRKANEVGESSNAASKITRFELNPENEENDWELPENMLDYNKQVYEFESPRQGNKRKNCIV